MTFQFRPRSISVEGDRQMYAPHRDWAHAGPQLLRPVAISLDPQWHEPWFAEFLQNNRITDDALEQAMSRLLAGVSKVINTKDPPEALAAVNFDTLPPAIQAAIYARVGQVFLAALWEGVKDVSSPNSAPPPTLDDAAQAVEDLALSSMERQRRTLWGRISSAISTLFGRFPTRT